MSFEGFHYAIIEFSTTNPNFLKMLKRTQVGLPRRSALGLTQKQPSQVV